MIIPRVYRSYCRYASCGLVVIFLACASIHADSGLSLLKIEQGARSVGMGAAFVSITGDPGATFYNPAATLSTREFTGSFTHTVHWDNVRVEALQFGLALSPRWQFHGGLRFGAVDNIEARTGPTEQPDFLFDSHDMSFKAGLAWQASPTVAVGFAGGWIIEEIEGFRGSAFNVDLGILARPNDKFNIGASVTNLGGNLQISKSGQIGSRDIPLPTTIRGGLSYVFDRYFVGAVDLVHLDDELHVHLGAESSVHRLFQVRGGYMANYDTKNITAGVSFVERNLSVDYAFIPYTNNLGQSHQFSLVFDI